MANFKDSEIEAAVTRFVREDVKTERTDLGPLSTDYAFDEVREFVASTLVFDPSAIFYLLSLSANRVNQDVIQALEYLDDVITAIDEVGRDTTKVTQTSLLEDATAALLEVERTIETKNAISDRPFLRYSQALDSFTDKSLTPNIRRLGAGFPDTYEIVRPPQQAQSSIKTNITELRDLHVAIIAEATQLTLALSEFLAANLPLASIQNTIPKVRNDLRSLKSQFDSATRDGAIEITRDAFLSIQAGKSVITNLTSISDPQEARMKSTASSSDRASAAYPSNESTPAELTTYLSAPYRITPTTNEVKIEVNGGSEQVVALPVPDRASIVGSIDETYDIHDISTAEMTSGLAGPYTVPSGPDNVFEIYADGVGYIATLTTGSRTAAQVAAEINAATRIDLSPGTFNDVGTASDDAGSLKLAHDTAGDHTIALGIAPVLNVALGFADEQVAEGEEANNELRLIAEDIVVVVISLTNGGARTAAQIAADISVSAYFEGSTETITTATGTITVPKITSTEYGEESHLKIESLTVTQEEAVKTFGFYEGQDDRGDYLRLDQFDVAISTMTGIETDISRAVVDEGNNGTAVLDGVDYKLRLPSGTVTGGPDQNDMLRISNGENLGWYNIVDMTLGGTFDDIRVDRPFPAVTGAEAQNQGWKIVRDRLTIRSTDPSISSALKVNAASANVVVGLQPLTFLGTVSGVRIKEGSKDLSFTREDVVAGDRLTLKGPTYTTEHTVTDVTFDGYQIEVTPEVKNDLVAHEYQIDGEGALAYATFAAALSSWFSDVLEPSKYAEDILELERTLNPLLTNKNPSAALVGAANTAANNLRLIYSESTGRTGLTEVLEDFTTSPIPRIDALLNMLQERGLNRAHDLLLLGELEEFFGATKDGASYGGNLLEKMRSIAQNDVPQGRSIDQDNVDDRLTGSYDEADADFDFSDQDDESGVPQIDDVPDLDEDEDVLNKSF
jgi:hypothetical protein